MKRSLLFSLCSYRPFPNQLESLPLVEGFYSATQECEFILQLELISRGLFRFLRDFSEVVGLHSFPFLDIFPHFPSPPVFLFKKTCAIFCLPNYTV